jgi:hypothetical protein
MENHKAALGENLMTSRRLLDDAAIALLNAADLLETEGWCQGRFFHASGARCALGALVHSTISQREVRGTVVSRLYRITGGIDITLWNDAAERTADEVVAALRAAALLGDIQ